jgi:hypothetical protein
VEEPVPLPEGQLKHLESSLHQHEQELQDLERGPDRDKPEVRARIDLHKVVLKVARDDKIRSVLAELNDDPQLIDQLADNPSEFLKARGIHLPAGFARIVTKKRTPESFMAGIDFRIGGRAFSLQWEKEWGFGVRVLSESGRPAEGDRP